MNRGPRRQRNLHCQRLEARGHIGLDARQTMDVAVAIKRSWAPALGEQSTVREWPRHPDNPGPTVASVLSLTVPGRVERGRRADVGA